MKNNLSEYTVKEYYNANCYIPYRGGFPRTIITTGSDYTASVGRFLHKLRDLYPTMYLEFLFDLSEYKGERRIIVNKEMMQCIDLVGIYNECFLIPHLNIDLYISASCKAIDECGDKILDEIKERIGNNTSPLSLVETIFPNSRDFTKEEAEEFEKASKGQLKPLIKKK